MDYLKDIGGNSKSERLFKEICSESKLEEVYHPILRTILKVIKDSGCTVSVKNIPGDKSSSYFQGHIRLSLKKKPLDGIWDLLHEYGHFLSGDLTMAELLNNPEITLKREILAWEYADVEIGKYRDLMKIYNHYEGYKAKCLANYHKYDEQLKKQTPQDEK